jgi:predicted Zn-dependent protease
MQLNDILGGIRNRFARWIMIFGLAVGVVCAYQNERNQAMPELPTQAFGPIIPLNSQKSVDRVGQKLVALSTAAKQPFSFKFQVLAAPQIANAFTLPRGQIYITDGLLNRLQTENELAGVLSHEIGHAIAGNHAEQIARNQIAFGLQAELRGQGSETLSAGQLDILEMSRANELEADFLGVCILTQAGYDPQELIRVIRILEQAAQDQQPLPEYLSTHPDYDNRIQQLQEAIEQIDGCPR